MGNGRSWWVNLTLGILAILLGLYLLVGGDRAAGNIALVAGIYILVAGVLELFRGRGVVSRYRGLISIIVGAVFLLLYFVDIFPTTWDFTVFAIGAILVGALGLYGSFFARSGRQFAWGPVIVNALLLLWGIFIFFFRAQDRDLQTISGWILIAMGVVFSLWAFLTRGSGGAEDVAAGEDTVADTAAAAASVEASVQDTPAADATKDTDGTKDTNQVT